MAKTGETGNPRRTRHWRIVRWSVAVFVLLLPLIAMQITDEVKWDGTDFAVAGALIVGTGLIYEVAAKMMSSVAYRAAVGVALAAAFTLIWLNLAVGIIGTEDNPANLMYGGVLAVGIIGSVIARFQPHGLAHTLIAMAVFQALVGIVAVIGKWDAMDPTWPADILGLTAIFAAAWLLSAWLFQKAAREQVTAGAAS
jgi:hypothetical protein